MGHPLRSNLTLLFYLAYLFFLDSSNGSYGYISDKKASKSVRIKATDHFLKSSGVVK